MDYYLGVDPGGDVGLALVAHNSITDISSEYPVMPYTTENHWCLKGFGGLAGWNPWNMRLPDGFAATLRAALPCKMEDLHIILEAQRAWGPGDGGTKIVMAYACIARELARVFEGQPSFSAIEPRTWEAMIRGHLEAAGHPTKNLKDKKLFTEAAINHFFGYCPKMTQHERDAACLAVCGILRDKSGAEGEQ